MKAKRDSVGRSSWTPPIVFFAIAAVIYVVWDSWRMRYMTAIPVMSANEAGDAMNSLTCLFTGLALAAVAVSIYFQGADYRATLKEMQEGQTLQKEQGKTQAEQLYVDRLNGLLGSCAAEVGLWRDMLMSTSDSEERKQVQVWLQDAAGRMKVYRRMLVDDGLRKKRDGAIKAVADDASGDKWD